MRQRVILLMSAIAWLLLSGSCEGQQKGGMSSGEDIQEIEFVRPVKEQAPEDSVFSEETHGTPIEGKQAAPKDELLHESTKEEEELWY